MGKQERRLARNQPRWRSGQPGCKPSGAPWIRVDHQKVPGRVLYRAVLCEERGLSIKTTLIRNPYRSSFGIYDFPTREMAQKTGQESTEFCEATADWMSRKLIGGHTGPRGGLAEDQGSIYDDFDFSALEVRALTWQAKNLNRRELNAAFAIDLEAAFRAPRNRLF